VRLEEIMKRAARRRRMAPVRNLKSLNQLKTVG
jgi:hypothetical protein